MNHAQYRARLRGIDYEHRINPDDPTHVEMRPRPRRRPSYSRGRHSANWRLYMACDSPRQAAHVVMLLRHGEPNAMVQP